MRVRGVRRAYGRYGRAFGHDGFLEFGEEPDVCGGEFPDDAFAVA